MKSSRSISNWRVNPAYALNTPRRANTPNRFLHSRIQNYSMLPPNRMKRNKNSINYQNINQNGNYSQMISASMDPRAIEHYQKINTSYYQNNFNPGFAEDNYPGALNRFSLSRVNNK